MMTKWADHLAWFNERAPCLKRKLMLRVRLILAENLCVRPSVKILDSAATVSTLVTGSV